MVGGFSFFGYIGKFVFLGWSFIRWFEEGGVIWGGKGSYVWE